MFRRSAPYPRPGHEGPGRLAGDHRRGAPGRRRGPGERASSPPTTPARDRCSSSNASGPRWSAPSTARGLQRHHRAGTRPGRGRRRARLEILVPALSFIASAVAPVHRLVVPVFVDIDPVTHTMRPARRRRGASRRAPPRSSPFITHGSALRHGRLRELSRRHGLLLIEDAAQARAAEYRGTRTGALGARRRLQPQRDQEPADLRRGRPDHHGRLRAVLPAAAPPPVRRELEGRAKRDYISHELAGNAKLSAVQAAFTRCQLDRLPEYHQARDRNVGPCSTGSTRCPASVRRTARRPHARLAHHSASASRPSRWASRARRPARSAPPSSE